MHVEGIISNPVTEDIKTKGHQSIRFSADGFSILISDASYKPVFLKQYRAETSVDSELFPGECKRILRENHLEDFRGETSIILDHSQAAVVPDQFFHEDHVAALLEKTGPVTEDDQCLSRHVEDRKLHILFTCPGEITRWAEEFQGRVTIMHTLECLLSLADQIQASDHQRGFVLVEVQTHFLAILAIREDSLLLMNRYSLNDPSEFIYHSLNTMKQLELDRESIPIYLSGIVHQDHELHGLLGKYVRKLKLTPYYLEELSRIQLLHYMILSEASKCA